MSIFVGGRNVGGVKSLSQSYSAVHVLEDAILFNMNGNIWRADLPREELQRCQNLEFVRLAEKGEWVSGFFAVDGSLLFGGDQFPLGTLLRYVPGDRRVEQAALAAPTDHDWLDAMGTRIAGDPDGQIVARRKHAFSQRDLSELRQTGILTFRYRFIRSGSRHRQRAHSDAVPRRRRPPLIS